MIRITSITSQSQMLAQSVDQSKDLHDVQAGNEEVTVSDSVTPQNETISQSVDEDGSSESQSGRDVIRVASPLRTNKYLRKQRRQERVNTDRLAQTTRSGRLVKLTSKLAQAFSALQGSPDVSAHKALDIAFAAAARMASSVGDT